MRFILSITCCFTYLCLSASPTTISPFFRVDQFGYPSDGQKMAFFSKPIEGFNAGTGVTPGNTFEVRQWDNDATVFSGTYESWKAGQLHVQSGDEVWWMDFSSFSTPGSYYLYDPSLDWGSYRFEIGPAVYSDVLKTAVRMFYYQRCGTEKPTSFAGNWADGASHTGMGQDLSCRSILSPNDPNSAIDLSGGWYDAGDYNKYVNFTYGTLHQLLFAFSENPSIWTDDYNIPESGNNIPDILDEILWELNWLKKMQMGDGSVLCKVSGMGFTAASPPSTDQTARFYGPAIASSTAVFASVFAHASLVFSESGIADLQNEANDLLARAEEAWSWILQNPSYSYYDNAGFQTANPEMDEATQLEVRTGAATLLFLATGQPIYHDFIINNYTSVRPYQWGYWYPFGGPVQDILVYYSSRNEANETVSQNIRDNFLNSATQGNQDLLPAFWNEDDAYRAFLKESDYVWGSNQAKAITGSLLWNLYQYQLSPSFDADFQNAASGYLHYLHGANPIGIVYLSNMGNYGAEHSANQIYHAWFEDGTPFDDASTSTGPAPGYLTGGCNIYYQPDPSYSGPFLSPPLDQPVQKSYKDWNTSWPENSWEITEPAIYYQAAYIRLLSKFTEPETISSLPHTISATEGKVFPNPGSGLFTLHFDIHPVGEWRVYNQLGKKLEVPIVQIDANTWEIDLLQHPTGLYWIVDSSGSALSTFVKQ